MQSLFLAAIGEARDRGARALEAFAYRYREGESAYERFQRAQDDLPARLPRRLRLPTLRAQGRVELCAARARRPAAGRGGQAREGAARRARRRSAAGAGAGTAAVSEVRSAKRDRQAARALRSSSSSAIWIAFSAAPLRRLSHARKSARPFSTVGSRRMRPTSTSSIPAALPGVGKSSTRTDGAAREQLARLLGRERVLGLDPDRLGVADEHRHAHARRLDRQVGQLQDLRVSARSFDSSSNSSPSKSQSMRRSCSSGGSSRSRSIACAPAPETDWYVATRTRTRPGRVVQRLQHAGQRDRAAVRVRDDAVVLERAVAVHLRHDERDARLEPVRRRLVDRDRAAAHRVRHELARRRRADGEEEEVDVAARERLGRRLLDRAAGRAACPAERADAKTRTLSYPRSRSSSSVTVPTAPVAPTTPIADAQPLTRSSANGRKRSWTARTARSTSRRADHARDADRRRGDDLDVDPCLGERVEHVGGDARVALHARSDQRDLRDVGVAARRARRRGPRELRSRIGSAIGRSVFGSVNEIVAVAVLRDVLDDHVDVHAGVRERAEHLRRDAGAVGDADDRHLRLRGVVRDAGDDRLLEHYVVLLADPGSLAVARTSSGRGDCTP